jgi:hypothetical protein
MKNWTELNCGMTMTQHLLPALQATAHMVDHRCYQAMMTQQPHHLSQPHEQLLMG